MQQVLITGGSGLVGTRLTHMLLEKGYQLSHLSRSHPLKEGVKPYVWNIKKKEIEPKALRNTDYIIHLAGANVTEKRWTKKRKEATKLIHDAIARLGQHKSKPLLLLRLLVFMAKIRVVRK